MATGGFFLNGANAKIIVNGITLAYATDIAYRISVKHATPRVLGMVEATEITPLYYEVTGSFTIIRYAKDVANIVASSPNDVNGKGNSIGSWKVQKGNAILDAVGTLGTGAAEGKTHESFVPARIAAGVMCDIEIRQMVDAFVGATGPSASGIPGGGGFFGSPAAFGTVRPGAGSTTERRECTIAKIRSARITDSDFALTKRGVATQRFTFMARYADEDGFSADKSGIGQDL